MSRFVKELLIKEFQERLADVDSVVVLNPRGIDANKNNDMRRKLHQQGLRMLVIKNTLTKRAVADTQLAGFEKIIDGPSAVVFGDASISAICRLILDEKKGTEIELRGVYFDGSLYEGEAGVEQVSKMPTREEAIANLVGCILAPARNIAGALKGPSSKIAGILKTIEEKGEDA